MKGCDQVYKKIINSTSTKDHATLTVLINWVTTDGVVFIEEKRTQTFKRVEAINSLTDLKLIFRCLYG